MLKNGWQSEQVLFGTGDPAYAISGGIVYVSGSLTGGKLGWPAAARPADQLQIETYTGGYTSGTVYLVKNSASASSSPVANARGFTSLGGITYPLSS